MQRMKPKNVRHTESRLRVRYKETDQMGIAHHSNYVVWFEVGRTDLCREAGMTYREIEDRGYVLVVTEIGCKYRSPFRYDDEVVIRTEVAQLGSRAMQFGYELFRGDERCASGFSRHFWLDRETRRPVVAPADIIALFEPYCAGGEPKE